MKHFKYFVAVCLCCSFLIPTSVYADTPTWFTATQDNPYTMADFDDPWIYKIYSNNSNVRFTILQNGNQTAIYGVYTSNDYQAYRYADTGFSEQLRVISWGVNGVTYYLCSYSCSNSKYVGSMTALPLNNMDISTAAVYYTFGEGAVEPLPPTPPPPAYGDLVDVRFNTSIAGLGSAAVNNIDHITWNSDHDSNEIMFDGTERVQIKAIAGNYTSSTRNGLLAGTVTDFDYNSSVEHMLAEYPVTRGYYDVTWSHVIEQLHAGSISDFLQIRKDNETWLKSGWIYQIRLVAGEYTGQWITIYNGTSSGVQNALNIENSTEINTTLINTIQQINNLNNSIDEDWTINNITINMENSDGTTTTDKPWWAYLLEAIVSLCSGILSFLGNLIGDLIDAIVSLFQPDEFTINNFNEYKLELKQNSGIFGQAIDFTTTLKNTFLGVQYQEPIIHWTGISFGETELIPAADYNLNDYVTMWGLGDFRTMAYLCSDGFIYFSLLVLIVRKLNEVLKK